VYLEFYGLREKPFNPTPDPRFLYLSTGHREALAQLQYGVRERRGFLVLTGEVGTGKTTLLRTLLEHLDEDTACAFVFNSTLRFDEIIEYVLEDFGIEGSRTSHAQRLFALNRFLTDRARHGRNTVLIIDEAQNLDVESLEGVRLLSNFETPTEKLLQILLVGQPELKKKLDLPILRQLKQRITLRCRIHPLSEEETANYIQHRLKTAVSPFRAGKPGAGRDAIFSPKAIARICEYSGGVPRVVNTVCDHCLLIGYADQNRKIDVSTVEEAIDYLEEGEQPSRRRPKRADRKAPSPSYRAMSATLVAALILGAAVAFGPHDAFGLVLRVASSLENLALRARDILGHFFTASAAALS
jgi:general secretion pathway protein A